MAVEAAVLILVLRVARQFGEGRDADGVAGRGSRAATALPLSQFHCPAEVGFVVGRELFAGLSLLQQRAGAVEVDVTLILREARGRQDQHQPEGLEHVSQAAVHESDSGGRVGGSRM